MASRTWRKEGADGRVSFVRLREPVEEIVLDHMLSPSDGWVETTPSNWAVRWVTDEVSMKRWEIAAGWLVTAFLAGFVRAALR